MTLSIQSHVQLQKKMFQYSGPVVCAASLQDVGAVTSCSSQRLFCFSGCFERLPSPGAPVYSHAAQTDVCCFQLKPERAGREWKLWADGWKSSASVSLKIWDHIFYKHSRGWGGRRGGLSKTETCERGSKPFAGMMKHFPHSSGTSCVCVGLAQSVHPCPPPPISSSFPPTLLT